jgi:flagellar biosynthesis protein FliR
MNPAQINHAISQLGGTHITAFFLVLARVAPLFVLAPLFSSKMVPRKVRGIVAVALSIGLTGVAAHGQHIPGDPLQVALMLVEGLLVGLAFAFAVGAVFAAIQHAGAIIDSVAGFGFGSLVDPVNGNQGGVLTQVYSLVGLMIFIAIGGDAWMLRGLARTFSLVPLTHGPRLNLLAAGALQSFASIFTSAIEVAAPALLALIITDVAFGMVSRVVPQLNVFAVGFPAKVTVGLVVIGASLPFLAGWLDDELQRSVGSALQALNVAG